jgi:hypothetical protein
MQRPYMFLRTAVINKSMQMLDENLIVSPQKSLSRKILGSIGIILGIAMFILYAVEKPQYYIFIIIYAAYMIFAGVVFVIDGSGISISGMLGKAFAKIDAEQIKVKPGIFNKEFVVSWKDVEKVEFKLFSIQFFGADGNLLELKYDNLDYTVIQKIKQVVANLASTKNIQVVKN